MDLARAKLLCGNGTRYIDKQNVNFTQIPNQNKTFLKNLIEINVLKLKIKIPKNY